ncbi:MAG: LysR family transcriptional regulator [Burkholderiales bacterium]|nr:LysR family transcriptional regulator [Burkholderiales bacterium]MDE1925837.1 LysR family transcriptional regulator [Burkholderiales bacterium]
MPVANITLRQLRAFVEVAHSGGFTAASTKLHLTQSATSLLVRELESQLGIQMLDRTTRQTSLTAAGEEFLLAAERVLADLSLAVLNAQDLVQRRRGRVTVGATPLLAGALLPKTIARFQETHPGITVRLIDLPTEQILRHVKSGDIDIGFGVFPGADPELQRVEMLRHRLGAMVPSAWPLAKRSRNLVWADLAEQPFIAMSHATGFRALVDPFLHQAGVALKPKFEVNQLGTAVGLAEAGLGITVVPAYVAALLRSNDVRFRVLHDPIVYRHVELVSRAGKSLSPGAQDFCDCIERFCKELRN